MNEKNLSKLSKQHFKTHSFYLSNNTYSEKSSSTSISSIDSFNNKSKICKIFPLSSKPLSKFNSNKETIKIKNILPISDFLSVNKKAKELFMILLENKLEEYVSITINNSVLEPMEFAVIIKGSVPWTKTIEYSKLKNAINKYEKDETTQSKVRITNQVFIMERSFTSIDHLSNMENSNLTLKHEPNEILVLYFYEMLDQNTIMQMHYINLLAEKNEIYWNKKVRIAGIMINSSNTINSNISFEENANKVKKIIFQRKWNNIEFYFSNILNNSCAKMNINSNLPKLYIVDKNAVIQYRGNPCKIDVENIVGLLFEDKIIQPYIIDDMKNKKERLSMNFNNFNSKNLNIEIKDTVNSISSIKQGNYFNKDNNNTFLTNINNNHNNHKYKSGKKNASSSCLTFLKTTNNFTIEKSNDSCKVAKSTKTMLHLLANNENLTTINDREESIKLANDFIRDTKIKNLVKCEFKHISKKELNDSNYNNELLHAYSYLLIKDISKDLLNINQAKLLSEELKNEYAKLNIKLTINIFHKKPVSIEGTLENNCCLCKFKLGRDTPKFFCYTCKINNSKNYTYCINCVPLSVFKETAKSKIFHEHVLYYVNLENKISMCNIPNMIINSEINKIPFSDKLNNQEISGYCDNCYIKLDKIKWTCMHCYKKSSGEYVLCEECFLLSVAKIKKDMNSSEHDPTNHIMAIIPCYMNTYKINYKKYD